MTVDKSENNCPTCAWASLFSKSEVLVLSFVWTSRSARSRTISSPVWTFTVRVDLPLLYFFCHRDLSSWRRHQITWLKMPIMAALVSLLIRVMSEFSITEISPRSSLWFGFHFNFPFFLVGDKITCSSWVRTSAILGRVLIWESRHKLGMSLIACNFFLKINC